MINSRNAGLLLGLGVLGLASITPASAQLVISQVYGGGGNASAPFRNDFVELFNNGTTAASLANFSLQYASAANAFSQKVNLSGSVPAGRFFLIQLGSQANVGTDFTSSADLIGGNVNISATAGKLALVNNTTLLTSTAASQASVLDFVGYGTTASTFEGLGRAPAGSNTASVSRRFAAFLAVDTNNNNLDFTTAAPTIRNTSTLAPVPAPSSVAVMALGGLMPLVSIVRRRAAKK